MEAKNKDLWVFIEADDSGRAKNVGLELISKARELAGMQGGKLVGVVIGSGTDAAVKAAAAHGADKLIVVDAPEYAPYSTDAFTKAFGELAAKYAPTSILIGATSKGRDLAPRLSCRLKTGLTTDCSALDIDESDGNLACTRPAFGGNLMATIICPNHRPQIVTIRPGVFRLGKADEGRSAEIIREEIRVSPDEIRTRLLETIITAVRETVELEDAEIIVSGGGGCGEEGFKLVHELAAALGGAVGASRVAVDEGWIAYDHQIGQTGKTVRPKLYIACGISGAVHHTSGMSGSKVIVAINNDETAPILNIADYGVVGDLFEVIPVLTKEVKKLKGIE
ncbi:MAG: electron transfer flavoprotein subunit alpha/FixB family protein [Oscillospiraceae bacterium]|jgi:electron transfer flavoprotein alpha subunit|nr:electron transfer flavoprotein subunit alpha/FixB family protein [Oscillospiraceae bacterium]